MLVVEILVLLGAHHNTANALDNNKYPIHYAAEYGHIHIIKFLLENGANFDEIASNNKSVLDYAKCSSSSDCKTACENKRDLLPLIQQINWKNRSFIEAALSDLKNATFRKNCPHNLNQFFYAENDVSLWACLDDNLEVLKQYSGEVDRAKYLPIVLASRRKELLDYYLNSENEYGAIFDITEWDFQCVIFSGDYSNIEHPRLNGFFFLLC